MAVVALDGLTKRYGAFLAVDQVSFELGKGEILGLLGPNGSGKTTILRMLTGYLRPSAGTAQVAGFDIVRDGRAARGRVGYVPEDAPLYRHMRVNEFLSFMGRLRGLEQEKLRERLAVARERFALQDMGDAIVGRLSRGYRQRVSLAQAVLHEPDLLVLDEPTNGLDPRQIIEFRELIRRAAEQCAILITSHILGEMERIADRVAILLQGRLLAVKDLDTAKAFCVRARNEIAPRVGALLELMAGAAEVVRGRSSCSASNTYSSALITRFLLVLVLRGGSIKSLLLIVTAFTIAHGLALGLAVFGVVRPPIQLIEPLIALSIAYAAFENIVATHSPSRRWLASFLFGLVHGFGFAGALIELGLPSSALASSLLFFNLGVRLVKPSSWPSSFPALLSLSRLPGERRAVKFISAAVLTTALALFAQRALEG